MSYRLIVTTAQAQIGLLTTYANRLGIKTRCKETRSTSGDEESNNSPAGCTYRVYSIIM